MEKCGCPIETEGVLFFKVSGRLAVGWLFNSEAVITATGEAESARVRSVRRVPMTTISSTAAAVVAVVGACCAKLVAGNANAATLALANNNLLDSLIKSPLGSKLSHPPKSKLKIDKVALVTVTFRVIG